MSSGSAESPNRSRWMRTGRECMAAGDWAGAIRAYAQGLMEQPLLGMHYAANLERALTNYRKERQTINQQGVGEREPITLEGLKRLCHGLPEPRELMGPLWTRLAVDLARRADGIVGVAPLATASGEAWRVSLGQRCQVLMRPAGT